MPASEPLDQTVLAEVSRTLSDPVTPPVELRPVQRSAAYAVLTDGSGAVLLVRASSRSDLGGRWFLPGGGLRHGEHPQDAVLRELTEESGLVASRATPREATADVIDLPHRGVAVHTLRLIYDVRPADLELGAAGAPAGSDLSRWLRPERDGTSDLVRFVRPQELADLPLMPFVAHLLGLPEPAPLQPTVPDRPEPLDIIDDPGPRSADVPVRMQRPAAYAVLIDPGLGSPAGRRILLTRLNAVRTGTRKDTWTLPGGGIDHGEHPLVALEREVYEETGLRYSAGPLLDLGSRHFVGRSLTGRLEDFHGLRLIYTGSVPVDLPPTVIEVDGSTDEAAWIPLSELGRIHTVPAVRESLAIWTARCDAR